MVVVFVVTVVAWLETTRVEGDQVAVLKEWSVMCPPGKILISGGYSRWGTTSAEAMKNV